MSVNSIDFIPANMTLNQLAGLEKSGNNGSDFSSWFNSELSALNTQIIDSDIALEKLASGETGNLHEVMMALEKAKTSFDLTLQVRNKLLEGYQQIMRMQI